MVGGSFGRVEGLLAQLQISLHPEDRFIVLVGFVRCRLCRPKNPPKNSTGSTIY